MSIELLLSNKFIVPAGWYAVVGQKYPKPGKNKIQKVKFPVGND
jgi:hypothetical protein